MTKIVVWDAGHGGKDPGGSGFDLKEKNLTLQIVKKAAALLEEQFADVQSMMIRSTDVFVDLNDRTAKANKLKADVLISIHTNAGGGLGGFESYIYNGYVSDGSIRLQQAIHTAMATQLKPFQVMDRGARRANLHMVRESDMPAVLTENLFIDVAKDAVLLRKAEMITALAQGHVTGVAQFLELKPKRDEEKITYSISTDVTLQVNEQIIPNTLLINGMTYAPIRTVGDALGMTVAWDGANKLIQMTSKKGSA